MLTRDFVNEMYEYNDGKLMHKRLGHQLGGPDTKGYLQCRVKSKLHSVHRIIFLMHHGYLPKIVDHIDGDKQNNRIENLRASDDSKNQWNRKAQANKTGVKGVGITPSGSFTASLKASGKNQWVGTYKTLEAAVEALQAVRTVLHGEYARDL